MRSPFTTRTLVRTGVVAVAAAALTWAVVRPLAEPDDRTYHQPGPSRAATVGRYYDSGNGFALGVHRVTITVPTSRITVTVGAPVGTVSAGPDATGDDLTEFHAPGGGSLVRVTSDVDATVTTLPAGTYARTDPPYTLGLVADGKTYAITRGGAYRGNVVAVAGRHPHLSVAVGYAGVTQTVDLRSGTRTAGAAAPLYRTLPTGTTACGTPTVTAPYRVDAEVAPVICRLDHRRVPYVPGLGWARPGRSWLLTSVSSAGPTVFGTGTGTGVDVGGRGQVRTASSATTTMTCGTARATQLSPAPTSVGDGRRDGTTLFACAVPSAGAAPAVVIAEAVDVYGRDTPVTVRWTAVV